MAYMSFNELSNTESDVSLLVTHEPCVMSVITRDVNE